MAEASAIANAGVETQTRLFFIHRDKPEVCSREPLVEFV